MVSSSKLSMVRKELNYTHNLSQYSQIPYEGGYPNSVTPTEPNIYVKNK
jgi:hypothetical protein